MSLFGKGEEPPADLKPDNSVPGERGIASVNRAPSMQSRISSILAMSLMSALGLGLLTWYYANTLARHTHAVERAQAASKAKARGLGSRVRFEVLDANQWQPQPSSVDMIWIMESSEHFRDKPGFFERCATALKPGGVLAVCAWLRRDGPLREEEQPLVSTIAEAMLSASLGSLSDYRRWMRDAGLTVTTAEDITRQVSPTWSHCARIGDNPAVRFLIRFADAPTRRFVRSFPLMRQAYAQGAMAFGLLVARKSS